MSFIESGEPGTFRSYNVKPPSSVRMDALYGEYEDRFGDPVRRPYPSHLVQYQSVFLSEIIEDGVLVGRGAPIWELIWAALHRTKARGGLVFKSNERLDLAYYANLIGCSEECLQPFREIFRDFETIDPNVPPFGHILRAKLAGDLAEGELVTYPNGRIDDYHYGIALDVEPHLILQYRAILEEYHLRGLIERDAENSELVADRGNKISRRHYAELIGIAKSELFRKYSTILAEYEDKYFVVTGPMARIDEMREWFTAKFDSGTLQLRDGKADRTEFAAYFELRGWNFLTRHPEIRAMIDGIDERIASEEYRPRTAQTEIEKVKAYLDGEPKINKDRLTVEKKALCSTCAISIHKLRAAPISLMIEEFNRKRLAAAKESRIDPYAHGRVYCFSDLRDVWSEGFLANVGEAFKVYAFGIRNAKYPYLSLITALRWIGESENSICRAVVEEAGRLHRVVYAEWENALYAYRNSLAEAIAKGDLTKAGAEHEIDEIRRTLDTLQREKVVPTLSTAYTGFKGADLEGRRRPNIVEAAVLVREGEEELRNSIRTKLLAYCVDHQVDFDVEEGQALVENLVAEVLSGGTLPPNPIDAVLELVNRRLSALQEAFFAIVTKGMQDLELGIELRAEADINVEKFSTDYFGNQLTRYQKNALLREYFPFTAGGTEADWRKSVANILVLIKATRAGIAPRGWDQTTGQFYAKRYLELGGFDQIEALLHPSPPVVGAVLLLYLLESGANVTVGRELFRDCVEVSRTEGYRKVTGSKAKANDKPIIVHLKEKDPAIASIEWLRGASATLEAAADNDDRKYLFLMRIRSRVQLMTPHWFTYWAKSVASSIPHLDRVTFTPGMIRPSILLRAALENDGRLQVGAALGQHGMATTQLYQGRLPVRQIYTAQIRDFHTNLETLVVSSVEGVARLLRISEQELASRIEGLRDTGLGVFCKNNLGRPGNEGNPCGEFDCASCPQVLLVAEVEQIAALRIWQESLEAVRGEWERDHPDRWAKKYAPWLQFIALTEALMSREHIKIWDAAGRRVEEIKKDPNFRPLKPW